MGISDVVEIVVTVAAAFGGYAAGKYGAWQGAASVNQLLQSRIDLLETDNKAKGDEITKLRAEMDVLKGMVTQRAEVQAVHEVVNRIEVGLAALGSTNGTGPVQPGTES